MDTRAAAVKRDQDKILGLLDDMGTIVDSLCDEDATKKQKLEEIGDGIRKIVNAFGEKFTEEARPILSFQKISFEELFEGGEAEIERAKEYAKGAFGKVFVREFRGQNVAIKIQERKDDEYYQSEIQTLRSISHDNIIGFRGWGEHKNFVFLVMEHLDKNLQQYVFEQESDENRGLSSRITWEIAKQIAQAMFYLHNLDIPIVHADLKPDNILVDTKPIIPKPKLIDFGLSRDRFLEGQETPERNIRYGPKRDEMEEAKTMEDLLMFDVYSFGVVVLFMRTGIKPYYKDSTEGLEDRGMTSPMVKVGSKYFIREVQLPPDLPGTVLGDLIKGCCRTRDQRPTFRKIREEYFGKDVINPFNLSKIGEFFECGFLKDTQIFVADSMVDDSEAAEYKLTSTPPGYRREDLICAVEVKKKPYHDKPKEEDLEELYKKHYRNFRQMAKEKKIDDNPNIALTELITERSGDDESQKIELRYKQKTYCHHRAMREVWRSFETDEKKKKVGNINQVHPVYSTSFGLHVAILTNEGPGKTKKFVFTRRSNKPGVASPGSYTCGAVESCSVKDFLDPEQVSKFVPNADMNKAYVSLVDTAARGLEEELGLPLQGSDKDAITLNTIYLKFDNHEWGMCGFVDLTSDKIREENRFSFEKLNAAFTSGPKDKFEHWQIHGVNFELRNMVEWIRENHDKLASSAKIVVVKVLQAFFGVSKVAEEFSKKM